MKKQTPNRLRLQKSARRLIQMVQKLNELKLRYMKDQMSMQQTTITFLFLHFRSLSVPFRENILTLSSFSAVRHIRWHTFSIRVASAFVLPNHLCFIPYNLSVITHAGFVDEMVSGNMVPSFPSSACKVGIYTNPPRMFTLESVYSGTCRARPILEESQRMLNIAIIDAIVLTKP